MSDGPVFRNPEPIVQFGRIVGYLAYCNRESGRLEPDGDWVIQAWRHDPKSYFGPVRAYELGTR